MRKYLSLALCMLVPLGLVSCAKTDEKTKAPPLAAVVAATAEP